MHRLWVQGPATTGLGSIGLLFMHEPRTPSGEHFILTCELCAAPDNAGVTRPMFQMWEFRPATWHSGIQMRNGLTTMMPPEIERAMRAGRHVRFFAGQPDASDPTHFTVRYDIAGVEGVLDGYEGDRTEDASGVPTPGLRLEVRKSKSSREDFR
jgi:hypothetical protein